MPSNVKHLGARDARHGSRNRCAHASGRGIAIEQKVGVLKALLAQ